MKFHRKGYILPLYSILLLIMVIFLVCGYIVFQQKPFQVQPASLSTPSFLKNLATQAVLTGSTNDWIYYSITGDQNTKGGLWRIHKETKKEELVWEGRYCIFLVLGEELLVQDREREGIYRMEPDGKNPTLIYQGSVNALNLCYEDGWVYFSVYDNRPYEDTAATSGRYLRYHIKTGETEVIMKGIRTSTWAFHSNFVVSGDYFYTVVWSEGKRGILSHHLTTGKQEICLDLDTGIEAPSIEGGYALFLTDGGEDLILAYLDLKKAGYTQKLCAAKKGEEITEKTVWKEIRFPDMQEQSAIPPNPPRDSSGMSGYAMMEGSESGYVFHDGYAYYLNEDWKLCSRPLFGKPEEVTVYEGTALARDQEGRYCSWSTTLAFSKDCFYYRYYSEVDEEDAAKNRKIGNYEPIPTKWEGYIGELP